MLQDGAALGDSLVWNGNLWVPGTAPNRGDMGAFYISTPAVNTGLSTTPTKVAGTTTALLTRNFTHTNGRLQYTGAQQKYFTSSVYMSVESNTANVTLQMFMAKDGVYIPQSELQSKITTANDVRALSSGCVGDCPQNTYMEVFIALVSGSANITVSKMIVILQEI